MFTSPEWVSLFIIVGAVVSVGSFIWGFAWWLSGKFNTTNELIDEKIEKLENSIVKKLEYHERHDDERFQSIQNDIWDIRVRNASVDGTVAIKRSSKQ